MPASRPFWTARRRGPAQPRPGQVHPEGDSAAAYRERLLAQLTGQAGDAPKALELIREEIAARHEAEERAHIETHLVRFLQTYLMVPQGPGRVVDIGGPSIHNAPVSRLKQWEIETVGILSIDYERDPLPYPDGTVDGVLLCEVIEHFVLDPLYCLIEVNRILRPGGFLVVTTPNAAAWFAVYQALRQRMPNRWAVYSGDPAKARNHIHAREYVVADLTALLEAAGFAVSGLETRDYGIAPEFLPVPGFPATHRGETIFARAEKTGPPKKRFAPPVYLEDVDFG